MVQAAPLQRVVQLAGAVGGEHHQRGAVRLDGADLRDADLEVRQHLEQERLELVVRAVHLVDQQHRPVAGPDRLQQRPLQQELGAEQLVDRLFSHRLVLGQRPDLQHLPGVVPLVQRLAGVDALVALEPDELAAEDRGEHLGHLPLLPVQYFVRQLAIIFEVGVLDVVLLVLGEPVNEEGALGGPVQHDGAIAGALALAGAGDALLDHAAS